MSRVHKNVSGLIAARRRGGRRKASLALVLAIVLVPRAPAGSVEVVELERDTSHPRPAPAWVRQRDLGEESPGLAGYMAPEGIQVDVVASEPLVVNPVGMRFEDDGNLLVLRWVGEGAEIQRLEVRYRDGTTRSLPRWVKPTPDRLDRLIDKDGDGVFDTAVPVMEDLEMPCTIVARDEGFWLSTRGSVLHRSRVSGNEAAWIESRPVIGLAGWHEHQASGLTFSPDGWLYITEGDEDSHPEASDGSREQVLRTGAVWRVRPGGARISLFALGFRNPFRDVVLDDFGNMFHADNDNEDGSKFQGCRLLNILEGADYGWRLADGVSCCVPDFERGSAFGELRGRMPAMIKTGRGSPAGLAVLASDRFPSALQGWLVWPDVVRKSIRAFQVRRLGSTFEVTGEFTLLESTKDGLFRPCQTLVGPDGALYVCDWRTDSTGNNGVGDQKHGRIWRLTWKGTPEMPGIARAGLDRWARLDGDSVENLTARLSSPDQELRFHALERILRKGGAARRLLLGIAIDPARGEVERSAALSGLCRLWDPEIEGAMLRWLREGTVELRRMAAEAIGRETIRPSSVTPELLGSFTAALADEHAAVRRAAALSLGSIGSLLPADSAGREHAGAALLSALRRDDRQDRFLHDGLLRGLERLGLPALRPLARLASSTAPEDRAFAVGEIEALRGRNAALILDEVLSNGALQLSGEELGRVLAAYGAIQIEPPPSPEALSHWLELNQGATEQLREAALRSLLLLGQSDGDRIISSVLRLLESPSATVRMSALRSIAKGKLLGAAGPLVRKLRENLLPGEELIEIVRALTALRPTRRWAQSKFSAGVDGEADAFEECFHRLPPGQIRREAMILLGQIKFSAALPAALAALGSAESVDVAFAIDVLASDPGQTQEVARRFLEGKIPLEHLPRIASALDRHLASPAPVPELRSLKDRVLRAGLTTALETGEASRFDELVKSRGNPARGLVIFGDEKRAACIRCHRIEARGGSVGPDLTGLHRSLGPSRFLEAIVNPSKEIKESFATWVGVTRSGQVYSGIKIQETADQIVLRDAEGRDVSLAREDIGSLQRSATSLMPEGVAGTLTLEELLDLVAFLGDEKAQATLRKPR